MKKTDRLFIIGIFIFIACVLFLNAIFHHYDFSGNSREHKVALNRVEQAIKAFENTDNRAPDSLEELYLVCRMEPYDCLTSLESIQVDNAGTSISSLVEHENEDYYIVATDRYIYKITYIPTSTDNNKALLFLNIVLAIVGVVLLCVYLHLRNNILKPFYEFSNLPYELAKGNMNKPLEESKNKYFGRFIWGMNMLRESIEESKARELLVQRDKKLLLLSLSHDIKTPLNAISLYAKAISKNLYKDEVRKQEVAENINAKVDEIESYISDIVKASSEDFLTFEVNNTEVYIGEVLDFIGEYYRDKTSLNNIDFKLGNYPNCLVQGDKDRIIEVIQNVVENAIKYGDGRRIWIETQKDGEEYIIKISNTGCKLPDNELSHIFDSFFRGTNVEKKNGSGLGLYICRQLVHLMEGEILAELISRDREQIMVIKLIFKLV
ncbi:MAG: HAMP domain-containing histidine kinase [Lachnospiraceae bacterium]|nr:HAMP domain-containing histidine kinase [Lachnospiraceae bacterium]